MIQLEILNLSNEQIEERYPTYTDYVNECRCCYNCTSWFDAFNNYQYNGCIATNKITHFTNVCENWTGNENKYTKIVQCWKIKK